MEVAWASRTSKTARNVVDEDAGFLGAGTLLQKIKSVNGPEGSRQFHDANASAVATARDEEETRNAL
jgi:hypothetical protein